MTSMTIRRAASLLAALALTSALAACGDGDGKAEGKAGAATAEAPSETLAQALAGADGLDRLEAVAANAGLTSVLEGVGPYTVFAPVDAAFPGTTGAELSAADARAPAAALVRAHIVPGALTRRDIAAALDRAGSGTVQMRTMADGLLTFRRDGEAVVVTAADGASARLSGAEEAATNGVLQPVDGLLVRAGTPAA